MGMFFPFLKKNIRGKHVRTGAHNIGSPLRGEAVSRRLTDEGEYGRKADL